MNGTYTITLMDTGETLVKTTARTEKWEKVEETTLPPNLHPDALKTTIAQQVSVCLAAYFAKDGPGGK